MSSYDRALRSRVDAEMNKNKKIRGVFDSSFTIARSHMMGGMVHNVVLWTSLGRCTQTCLLDRL